MLKPLVFLAGRVIVRDVRLELTDRHTHRPSTVTLAAHAHRGLITYEDANVVRYIASNDCWKVKSKVEESSR